MSLTNMLVPTYLNMLGALSAWLEKADNQDPDADALLSARLADDMFPLATQIRFSCVQALEGMHRLSGSEFSPFVGELLEEGRMAENSPGTIAEAQARIARTLAQLRDMARDLPEIDREKAIEHSIPNGMIFDLTAEQYVRDWAFGQFYFHVMVAYALLRNQGIDLGKADYVAHMFQYIRPGTMPSAG